MTLLQLAAALKDDTLIKVTQGTSELIAFYSKGSASIDATLGAATVSEIAIVKTNNGIRLDVVVAE